MSKPASRHAIETIHANAASRQDYVQGILGRTVELLQGLDTAKVASLIEAIEQAAERGNAIYLIGNGGAAGTTSHLVNDLVVPTLVEGRPRIRAFCLADNVPSITAIANDMGYENIFVHQLKTHLQARDLVVAFSVSGNSPNVVKAIEYARANGAQTVGVCGMDGGWLARNAELAIHVPTTKDEYGPVEDIFSCIGHFVGTYLVLSRGVRLCH